MGQEVGGYAGGIGSVAGGDVDDDYNLRLIRRGKADEPSVGLRSGGGAGGAGFAGDGNGAKRCSGGHAETDGIGEAGADDLSSGRTGMGGELEGEPAIGCGEFERRDEDAVDSKNGEPSGVVGLRIAEDSVGFIGGEAGLA